MTWDEKVIMELRDRLDAMREILEGLDRLSTEEVARLNNATTVAEMARVPVQMSAGQARRLLDGYMEAVTAIDEALLQTQREKQP